MPTHTHTLSILLGYLSLFYPSQTKHRSADSVAVDHFEQFQHQSLPLSARATPVAAPATAPATAPASAVRGRSSGMAPITSMNGMLRKAPECWVINFLGANQLKFHKSQWMSMDSELLNQIKGL